MTIAVDLGRKTTAQNNAMHTTVVPTKSDNDVILHLS